MARTLKATRGFTLSRTSTKANLTKLKKRALIANCKANPEALIRRSGLQGTAPTVSFFHHCRAVTNGFIMVDGRHREDGSKNLTPASSASRMPRRWYHIRRGVVTNWLGTSGLRAGSLAEISPVAGGTGADPPRQMCVHLR